MGEGEGEGGRNGEKSPKPLEHRERKEMERGFRKPSNPVYTRNFPRCPLDRRMLLVKPTLVIGRTDISDWLEGSALRRFYRCPLSVGK